MDNLKPCPFCGGEPYYTDAPYTHAGVNMILCGNCGCRFYNADCKKWNTRPTEATARAEALREAAERIRVKYATGIYGTSVEGIIKTILADKQEEK
jgi:hypothetical protein